MIKTAATVENTALGLAASWQVDLVHWICESCDWGFLGMPNQAASRCPYCFKDSLAVVTDQPEHLVDARPPEQVIPFAVTSADLQPKLAQFAQSIRFEPADLTAANLTARLQRLYLPRWLVDASVQATWQSEAGFNYDVVSHQDSFDENTKRWNSRQMTETRVQWEPRVGLLTRTYHNVRAPAIEEEAQLRRQLGLYEQSAIQPYLPQNLAETMVRLPNRSINDAWVEAKPQFQAAAQEECRQAAQADHIREFRWRPEFHNLNWTQMLLPVWTTYYLDDQDEPRRILINGQTGQLSGIRRASMVKAKRLSLIIGIVAGAIFGVSVIAAILSLLADSLLLLAGLGVIAALFTALTAIAPIAMVSNFNATQERGKHL